MNIINMLIHENEILQIKAKNEDASTLSHRNQLEIVRWVDKHVSLFFLQASDNFNLHTHAYSFIHIIMSLYSIGKYKSSSHH